MSFKITNLFSLLLNVIFWLFSKLNHTRSFLVIFLVSSNFLDASKQQKRDKTVSKSILLSNSSQMSLFFDVLNFSLHGHPKLFNFNNTKVSTTWLVFPDHMSVSYDYVFSHTTTGNKNLENIRLGHKQFTLTNVLQKYLKKIH